MGTFLNDRDRAELRELHRQESKRRYADRIKSVLMLDEGLSAAQIARYLLLDEKTVTGCREKYLCGGVEELCSDELFGRLPRLSLEQLDDLEKELRENIYLTTNGVIAFVEQRFGISYSASGMASLLGRIGFSYKKPKIVPGKANADAQIEFQERLEELKVKKPQADPLYYMDGVHPQHNSVPAYGWFPKGEETPLKTNSGRQRLNLNGALNAETKEIVVQEHETLNAQAIIVFLTFLESLHPLAKKIYVVSDNAKYYKNLAVQEFLLTSKIVLLHLPTYAPNLNLIERVWKLFKKEILANRYYATFSEFKQASLQFFEADNWNSLNPKLLTLLTNKFHIVNA